MCILDKNNKIFVKRNIKELCDFTTIGKKAELITWDNNQKKYTVTLKWDSIFITIGENADNQEETVTLKDKRANNVSKECVIAIGQNKIQKCVEDLLNNVQQAVKNIDKKKYGKRLLPALKDFRHIIGNIISNDGSGTYFRLVTDIKSGNKDFDYYTDEYNFPCYKQISSNGHAYYFYTESIKDFFNNFVNDSSYLKDQINKLKQVGFSKKGQQGAIGIGLLIKILKAELKYGNQSQAKQEIEKAVKSDNEFINKCTNKKAKIFINQSCLRFAKIARICNRVHGFKKKKYQKKMNEVYFYFSDEEVRELEERCRHEEKDTIPIDNMLNYKQDKFPLQKSLGEKLQALKYAVDLETCGKRDINRYERFITDYKQNNDATAVNSIKKIANTSKRNRRRKIYIAIASAILILMAATLVVYIHIPDIRYNLTYSYPYSAQSGEFEFRKYDNSGAEIISAIPTSDDGVVEFPSQVELVKQDEVEMFHKDIVAIGSNVFGENADTIKSIIIPASVTSIGEKAFSGCSSLTSVIFEYGSRLTKIDSNAFAGCSKLEQIIIPSGVTKIGENAFAGCSKLEQIVIPSSVTEIGENAFAGCNITICCGIEESQAPSGWAYNWNGGNVVLWGWIAGQEREVVVDGLRFMLNGYEATLTEYNLYNNAEVEIPVKVYANDNEYPVTTIKDNVFSGHAELKNIIVPKGITSIGEMAFFNCSGLTSITIPDSVTSIGDSAFSGCSGLRSITIPDSVTSIGSSVFSGCSGLTSITIPDSVTSIGDSAFSGCNSLTSITIPFVGSGGSSNTHFGYIFGASYSPDNSRYVPSTLKEVVITGGTSIGERAFYNCNNLTSITIPDDVTSIGDYVFYGCSGLTNITIPDSVTSIGDGAFYDCRGLTSITIPDSVTSIGNNAFQNCRGLTSITIPDGVTSIGNYAFYGCSNLSGVYISDLTAWCEIDFNGSYNDYYANPLYYAQNLYLNDELITQLEIPEGVTSIANTAFAGCSGLTSIKIPDSVTSIGHGAFYNCTNLSGVYIADLAAWCEIDFIVGNSNPLYYAHNLYLNDELIQQLVIPEGVTSIGDGAFVSCNGLTGLTIPDSVTSIGRSAFSGCSGLKSVSIQSGITSIGDSAFSGCSGLTSMVIPDSVTSIGSYAFEGCSGLTSITIPFVGSGDSNNTHFGYIFGASSYSNNSSYVPSTLKEVIITGETSIESRAFQNCNSLTSITIPDSVTSIGSSAFQGCSGLTSITMPDSVTSIGSDAFSGCSGLTSITIPDSVTSIGSGAFESCSSLTSITIPFVGAGDNDNTHFGYIFGASSYSNNSSYVPSTLKEVIITGGASIEIYAFYNCSGLTNITIPDSVTSIGSYAFYNCSGLGNIDMSESTRTIGYYAFRGCSNLRNIIISDSVTSIGNYAFYGCNSLTIYCEAGSKPSGWDPYWNTSDCPVVWAYRGDVAQYIECNKYNCTTDNGYNINDPDITDSAGVYGVNSDVCEIVMRGVGVREDGAYTIVNGNESLQLDLHMLQSYDHIELTDYPGNTYIDARISNDGFTWAQGTSINKTIGRGAVYIFVTYTDGTADSAFATDIMNGRGRGDNIDILGVTNLDIARNKTVSQIDIHVVYEIEGDWKGIFDSTWHTWTNWHCINTLKFV